ncbi:SEC-C metal-binding domain-containing protein [Rossellomorea sp. H39__3]
MNEVSGMNTVGRNEPCPCGSGKKYKKCHGKENAIDIDALVKQELDVLQAQAYDFIATTQSPHMEELYHQYLSKMELMKADPDIYEMAFVSWYGVTQKDEEGLRLIDRFVDKQTVTRPQTAERLESWKKVRITAGSVEKVDDETLRVTEAITGDELLVKEAFGHMEEGSFFLGLLLPNGDSYIPFAQYFIYPIIEKGASEMVKIRFEQGEFDDLQEYLAGQYLELADVGFVLYGAEKRKAAKTPAPAEEKEETTGAIEGVEIWKTPEYIEAIKALQDYLEEKGRTRRRVPFLLRCLRSTSTPSVRRSAIRRSIQVPWSIWRRISTRSASVTCRRSLPSISTCRPTASRDGASRSGRAIRTLCTAC